MQIAVPDVMMEYCVDALNKRVPVKGTLSKHLVTLDVAYCQLWHAKWKSLCAQEASVFFMADSSPQFGSNWLLKRCTIVKDIAKAVEVQEKMVSLLPTDLGDDEEEWKKWVEGLTTTDLSHIKKTLQTSCVRQCAHMCLSRQHWPPAMNQQSISCTTFCTPSKLMQVRGTLSRTSAITSAP